MSKRLEEIDPNLKAVPLEDGLCFTDVRSTAARICGLAEGEYVRLPPPVRAMANEKLLHLQTNTSGGRVRFVTNSRRLGFRLRLTDADGLPHMAYSGYAGVDCYVGEGGRGPVSGHPLARSGQLPAGQRGTPYRPVGDGDAVPSSVRRAGLHGAGGGAGGVYSAAARLFHRAAHRVLRVIHHPGGLRQPPLQYLLRPGVPVAGQ